MKALMTVAGLFFLTVIGLSQRDFSTVEIKETLVKDNFYMLDGSGGNILIYVGPTEVLMIDSQFAPLSDKIKTKIDQLSGGKPITYLINTHHHGDHTGGNGNFSEQAMIIAHKNVKQRLSTDQHSKAFNKTTKAKDPSFWPKLIYAFQMELTFEDKEVMLIHLPYAHTDGDSGVLFLKENVLHLGDTFFKDRFPYIDLGSGGTIDGLINGLAIASLYVDKETKIIPGHGKLATKQDLDNYHLMLKTMKGRVVEAIANGKSLEEIKASGMDKGYEEWGTGFINAEKFMDTIWTDLNREEG